jgi:hypothetical protein
VLNSVARREGQASCPRTPSSNEIESFGVFRCLWRGSVPTYYPREPKTLAHWGRVPPVARAPNLVEGEIVGYLDFKRNGDLETLKLVTEKASYGGRKFGVAVELVK